MDGNLEASSAEKLAKVCGLLGSSSDGEALNAARMADALVKKSGTSWEAIFRPFSTGEAADWDYRRRTANAANYCHQYETADWRSVAWACLDHSAALTAWEKDFLENILERSTISGKQHAVLDRLEAKCRAFAEESDGA